MTESKVETPFDRGARILNAVIAEIDIPADLKGNAQSVICMLAEFLPKLLAPLADAPASGATTTPPPQSSDDSVSVAWLNDVIDSAQNAQPARTRARVTPTPPAATHKPAARRRHQAEAATQKPGDGLAGLSEADVQLIWNAYAMVVGLQRKQAERLSEALIVALRGRVDVARVVELLTSTSIDATRLWRVALDELAKA